MIFPLLLMLAQASEAAPIAPLAKQALPTRGCAAYLFTRGVAPVFVAMAGSGAGADPASLRVMVGGVATDLPRIAQSGAGGFGFAGVTEYEGGGVKAVLDMTIVTRADLKDGAAVSEASLRLERSGQDSVVVPIGGIVACAP